MSSINSKNISFIIILLFLVTITFIYIAYTKSQDLPTYVDLYHTTEED